MAVINKEIEIVVFDLSLTPIGEVNEFTSLTWPDAYSGYGSFELWAPITEENATLLKQDNILWAGGTNAALIENVKSELGDNGEQTFNVKGRTLEMFMTTRVIKETYVKTDYPSNIAVDLMNQNCINPIDVKRKIPNLYVGSVGNYGTVITYQKTGKEVYEAIKDLLATDEIGFSIDFDVKNKKLFFNIINGVDRTINQNVVDPVVFSTDLEDILESSYYTNKADLKTTAYVAGEGEGANRAVVLSGLTEASGYNRRELYVDARDLQKSSYNSDDGQTTTLTDEQYQETLKQRGIEKLSDVQAAENFEATIRVFGDVQYVFGVDYNKGDLITVQDKILKVQISARITQVQEEFNGDEYSLVLTFGYTAPTILDKVKSASK